MKTKLAIFGTGENADCAYFYFTKDTNYEIKFFILDKEYITEQKFHGLPIISTEEFLKINDKTLKIFIAVGYKKLNKVRKEKYEFFKKKKYRFASYISPRAIILNNDKIGEHCFILENNVIQPYVVIKNNVVIWSGNHIGHHSIIGSHSYITSHVVISGNCNIGEETFIGINSSINNQITVGKSVFINAGCLIKRNLKDHSVVNNSESNISKINSTKIKL